MHACMQQTATASASAAASASDQSSPKLRVHGLTGWKQFIARQDQPYFATLEALADQCPDVPLHGLTCLVLSTLMTWSVLLITGLEHEVRPSLACTAALPCRHSMQTAPSGPSVPLTISEAVTFRNTGSTLDQL
jgi:hypothetical protein